MDHTFLIAFFDALNRQFNYAVLRNEEGLPYYIASRDIDILIHPSQFQLLKNCLLNLIHQYELKLLLVTTQQDCCGITIGDSKTIIQIDLLKNTDIVGVAFFDTETLLLRRIFNGAVYHLPSLEALVIKAVYCFALGAALPDRYMEKYIKMSSEDQKGVLCELAKINCSLQNLPPKGILRKKLIQNLIRRPRNTMANLFSSLWYRLWRCVSPSGCTISFSGPDGCGKTTVIELLRERLAVNPPILFHFRPSLLPNLGEVAHKAGAVKEVDRNFDRPHRGRRKGLISSLIRLAYYSCDYMIGYAVKILPLRQRKHIVFFDRYFTDIIVDGERSSIFLNYRFLARLRHFIPGCQYNFLFRVDPERILNRKQELSREAIERIYSRLEYLASRDGSYYWIDNNGTPEEAVQQILNILLEQQHRKYARKLLR